MVKIVVDSGCDIRREDIENDNCIFESVPLNLQIEDRVFIDNDQLDIDMFLNMMDASPAGAQTASPSPDLFVEQYKDGDSVFVVTLSSHLSGTYSNALLARNMYLEEHAPKLIHVFDSLSASVGESVIALKISELAKKGLTGSEIAEQVTQFAKQAATYFLLDKYDNLVKSGRINPYVAKIASVLNIKAIGSGAGGTLNMIDKTRGHNKAVQRLVEIIKRDIPDSEQRVVAISHVKCLEKAIEFKNELLKVIRVKDVVIAEAKGITAIYANRGGIVVAL